MQRQQVQQHQLRRRQQLQQCDLLCRDSRQMPISREEQFFNPRYHYYRKTDAGQGHWRDRGCSSTETQLSSLR